MTSKKSTEWLYYKLVEQSLFPWELMILEMVLVLVFCSITSVSRQWQYLLKFTVACQLRHFQNCIFSCRLSAVLCKYLMFITTAIEDIRWIYIYIYIYPCHIQSYIGVDFTVWPSWRLQFVVLLICIPLSWQMFLSCLSPLLQWG